MSDRKYLTLKEAAEYLRLTPSAMWQRVDSGAIPAWTYKRIGASYRFRSDWLDEWMEENYRALGRKRQSAA